MDSCKDDEKEIVLMDGHLTKIEDKINVQQADYAIALFNRIRIDYLSSNDCYFVLIPDKYKYLADKQNEYDEFYSYMCKGLDDVKSIDVYDLLCADDYYRSDPHIRQERLVDVSEKISSALAVTTQYEFNKTLASENFVGDYGTKTDEKVAKEGLYYLTNDTIGKLYTKESIPIYDFNKLDTDKQYDFFLSGNKPVVSIINESANTDRRLVVFRDSYASALAPLLACSYSEVVLVDLRYINSSVIADYVDFNNADALFIYSTKMINRSLAMR